MLLEFRADRAATRNRPDSRTSQRAIRDHSAEIFATQTQNFLFSYLFKHFWLYGSKGALDQVAHAAGVVINRCHDRINHKGRFMRTEKEIQHLRQTCVAPCNLTLAAHFNVEYV